MGQVVNKKLSFVNLAGMVSETVCSEMLSRTCRSNLVGEVVHKKLSYANLAVLVSRNAFADSLWKLKRQPSLLFGMLDFKLFNHNSPTLSGYSHWRQVMVRGARECPA
ncbi:hypothetical protein AVEN_49208-1 [Araneus ventricosus]|uniref:Uncharacterized protein n=1 Tax=Araneus ventricosus TaxID=182803 RepID=A0A4Y2R3A7_ARAVE|nr:hypothetical protein AVEN_49208-1 [Araneus ventricosus]